MPSHNFKSSRQIWTEYWRGGRQGCLTDEVPPSARNHIGGLWRTWFRRQSRGARILDLACGAGDVARLGLSVGAEAQLAFGIEGVDLAELDSTAPAHTSASGTTMRLRGGIDLAALPFPDHHFDCAVSQFGIEYADRDEACAELARVLKPGADGLLLLHHRESAISAAAEARLQVFAKVIGEGIVFDHARQTYEAIAAHATEPQIKSRLAEFRQSLRAAAATHAAAFAWEANLREMLEFLADLARTPHRYDPFDALRRLDTARDMIAAWKSRQESQLAAALDRNGMAALADVLSRLGLKPLEPGLVNDPLTGTLLAWQLTLAAAGTAES